MKTIFDAHLHIIDPRFPLLENQGFTPAPFTVEAYRHRTEHLTVIGGAVVSGSFQAFDQTYLVDALERLGPAFVGVTQVPATIGLDEIRRLDDRGIRAVRFNLKRGGSADVKDIEILARKVYDEVGWHTEVYIDGSELAARAPVFEKLPRVVIDHLGLTKSGNDALLRLVARGAYVKATGFGRIDFDPGPFLEKLVAENPAAVVFGTDLPSTRAARPFLSTDVDLVMHVLSPENARRVLCDNGRALFRLDERCGA